MLGIEPLHGTKERLIVESAASLTPLQAFIFSPTHHALFQLHSFFMLTISHVDVDAGQCLSATNSTADSLARWRHHCRQLQPCHVSCRLFGDSLISIISPRARFFRSRRQFPRRLMPILSSNASHFMTKCRRAIIRRITYFAASHQVAGGFD